MNNASQFKTPIIPAFQTLAKVDRAHELNLEAICIFAAIGFFLDTDTYWKDRVVLRPANEHKLDENEMLLNSQPWFQWHYQPRNITFDQALDEFIQLFEGIVNDQTNGKKVILPLSGGLDSRTQAAALSQIDAEVVSYAYEFKNGYSETKIAREIAETSKFRFQSYTIEQGYLWQVLDQLVDLNHCYSDFTSPRQMAIYNQFSDMGDVFSLGHWGDVLFDNMKLPQLSQEQEVQVMTKKLIKRGGWQLAKKLWQTWGLSGNFEDYFNQRITGLLNKINIENSNAKLRAFKSLYWAPRWTSINLEIFKSMHPIELPYYDEKMCKFICSIPEEFLTNRQLQIAYIKQRAPQLANITWQDYRPFNLYNYQKAKLPYNLSYKLKNKAWRWFNTLNGRPYVQRNWELQFRGKDNATKLKRELFDERFLEWVPEKLVAEYVDNFYNTNALQYAHAINMLLVLSRFYQKNQNE